MFFWLGSWELCLDIRTLLRNELGSSRGFLFRYFIAQVYFSGDCYSLRYLLFWNWGSLISWFIFVLLPYWKALLSISSFHICLYLYAISFLGNKRSPRLSLSKFVFKSDSICIRKHHPSIIKKIPLKSIPLESIIRKMPFCLYFLSLVVLSSRKPTVGLIKWSGAFGISD